MTQAAHLLLAAGFWACTPGVKEPDGEAHARPDTDSDSDGTADPDNDTDTTSAGDWFQPPGPRILPISPVHDPPQRYVPCPAPAAGAEVITLGAYAFADAVTYAPGEELGYYGWAFQLMGVDYPWNRSDPTVFQPIADGTAAWGHAVQLWMSLPTRAPDARLGTYLWAEPYGKRPGFQVAVYDDYDQRYNVVYTTEYGDLESATLCLSRVWPNRVSGAIDYTPTTDRHYYITFDVEGPDPAADDATHCLWNRYFGFTEAEAWDPATWAGR